MSKRETIAFRKVAGGGGQEEEVQEDEGQEEGRQEEGETSGNKEEDVAEGHHQPQHLEHQLMVHVVERRWLQENIRVE